MCYEKGSALWVVVTASCSVGNSGLSSFILVEVTDRSEDHTASLICAYSLAAPPYHSRIAGIGAPDLMIAVLS